MQTIKKIIRGIGAIIAIAGIASWFFSLSASSRVVKLTELSQIDQYNPLAQTILYLDKSANLSTKNIGNETIGYLSLGNKFIPVIFNGPSSLKGKLSVDIVLENKHSDLQKSSFQYLQTEYPDIHFENVILQQNDVLDILWWGINGGLISIVIGVIVFGLGFL